MKAMQIPSPGEDFKLVEMPIPTPAPNEVLLKVEACGICHSDVFAKEGLFPGIEYPRVPGHEVVGIIEKVNGKTSRWRVGQRVGVGWHGGHCFECNPCRAGRFINCEHSKITGISFDGGYAEYMTAPFEALALVPEVLKSAEAAPLLCAGITVFNALRNSNAKPGDTVVIQGIGGLGHLAIQYASKMGFHTIAVSGGSSKAQLAKKLGAHIYLDASKQNAVTEIKKLGGAKVILATAPNSEAITEMVNALGEGGNLIVVGVDSAPVKVSPLQLIAGQKAVSGWPSGTARDSEDTLNFSALTQSMPMIETFPLEQASAAYNRMMANKARFRVVLEIS